MENYENLANSFSEVLEVLKYIPKDDYEKIPKKFLNLLKRNCNEKSEFRYNCALPIEKQDLSEDAQTLLSIIYKNCWKKTL